MLFSMAIVGIPLFIGMSIMAFVALGPPLFLVAPRRKRTVGPFVAEVWLDWEICRGSTLYRQSFHSKRAAAIYAKLYAVMLDMTLPKYYPAEGWDGRVYYEKYDFEIRFGVRAIVPSEVERFAPIFSKIMPGHSGYSGEHREAHPLLNLDAAKLDGFKL
jgi:hypothetical protein